MTSLRGWFQTLTVLLVAAVSQLQAQSITDAPGVGSAVRTQAKDKAKPSDPTLATRSSSTSQVPIASRAMFGLPTGQAAQGPTQSPWYVPTGAPAQQGYQGSGFYPQAVQPAGYTQFELSSPPPPMPGMTASNVATAGKGGYGGCGGCTFGCDSCSGGGGCSACGGYGCASCQHGFVAGMLSNFIGGLLPFPEGGRCAPRWYDITIDAMYMNREDVSRTVNFASSGVNGNIVLSTDSLDFDHQLGMRLTGSVQFFAGSNIELTYFGLFNWATGDSVNIPTGPGTLYSVYSNFGLSPSGGFDETDRSTFQQITYSSTVDNFEINFRKRWQGANCRVQGSWLAGVRYVYLLEDFGYNTSGGEDRGTDPVVEISDSSTSLVTTRNSLTGFQMGGDLWTAIIPGVLIGAEGKAGVYGNYGAQNTSVFATTTAPAQSSTIVESAAINDISFVADASVQYIYRISPQWTLGGNYNIMYLDGVALAPENFNTAAPPNLQGASARTVGYNDNGRVWYHGYGARLEYIW